MMATTPTTSTRRKRTYTRERQRADRRVEVFWFLGPLAFHAFACNEREELDSESICGLMTLDLCADEPVRARSDFAAAVQTLRVVVCERCHRMTEEN